MSDTMTGVKLTSVSAVTATVVSTANLLGVTGTEPNKQIVQFALSEVYQAARTARTVQVTTNGTGVGTVTFSPAFPTGVLPNISFASVNAGGVVTFDITARSNTSVTFKAYKIAAVLSVLGISDAASVSVLVTAQMPATLP